MRFYHYTTKAGANGITQNALQQAVTAESEPWQCRESQPQIWVDHSKQHPKGFYLTTLSPEQIVAGAEGKEKKKAGQKKRKTGINDLEDPYVLVFDLPWVTPKKISKVDDSVNNGDRKIKKVGEPEKFCATRINQQHLGSDDVVVPFELSECKWAGPAGSVPKQI
ncbi:hypothetical protein [Paraburkholderia sp. JHI869]|uniref:hypothetical protein n=1 Tax=Paraburkholderia sp. JHI869 TaxID=3112959 RepID=UPI00317E447A